MWGKKSANIFQKSDIDDRENYLDRMMQIFDFFSLYDGQNEFWDMMKMIIKDVPGNLHNRVLHISDISSAVDSHAKELTKSKSLKIKGQFGKKEDRKRKGAELYLKLGNYKEFWEVMMELGEFDRALAFAPAVSMEYWKIWMQRYGEWLESHEERFTEAPLPYIAINEIDTAVEMLTANEEYEDSKLVRALKVAGVYQDIMRRYEDVKEEEIDHEQALKAKDNLNKDVKLIELTRLQAQKYFSCAQPILSCCSFLSINDYKSALIQLIRSDELFLAYILAYLLYPEGIKDVIIKLARRAEK